MALTLWLPRVSDKGRHVDVQLGRTQQTWESEWLEVLVDQGGTELEGEDGTRVRLHGGN